MRPLWLVFDNFDDLGDFVRIIFKNGDGKEKVKLHFRHVLYCNLQCLYREQHYRTWHTQHCIT